MNFWRIFALKLAENQGYLNVVFPNVVIQNRIFQDFWTQRGPKMGPYGPGPMGRGPWAKSRQGPWAGAPGPAPMGRAVGPGPWARAWAREAAVAADKMGGLGGGAPHRPYVSQK